jgi:photosystem II Psb27 protein
MRRVLALALGALAFIGAYALVGAGRASPQYFIPLNAARAQKDKRAEIRQAAVVGYLQAQQQAARDSEEFMPGYPYAYAETEPSPRVAAMAIEGTEVPFPRRAVLLAAAGAMLVGVAPAFAQVPEYKLVKSYPEDAKAVLEKMRETTDLTRGAPDFEDTVIKTRKLMNDFFAFYRRQPQISGKPSFSTLYTAINTLSGHFASYGNKYPVPAKRKERLVAQYKEVDRALQRGK